MKNSLNKTLIIVIFSLVTLSCSNDDDNGINLKDDSKNCGSTSVFDPTFTGTACCIQRNSELNLNGYIEYEYFTNLADPNIEWQVSSGDIEIVSGKNSKVVTIEFGDSFTGGVIFALGTGTTGEDVNLRCSESVTITTN